MNKRPLVTYVYHPHYPDLRVACLVALIREDGEIGIGWSQCHPTDNFDRKKALTTATYRARFGVGAVQTPYSKARGVVPQTTPYRFYNPDGSYVKKDVVGQALDLFRFRAMNYFAPKLAKDCDKSIGELKDIVFLVTTKQYANGIRAAAGQ